jgi:hypothetical protein
MSDPITTATTVATTATSTGNATADAIVYTFGGLVALGVLARVLVRQVRGY